MCVCVCVCVYVCGWRDEEEGKPSLGWAGLGFALPSAVAFLQLGMWRFVGEHKYRDRDRDGDNNTCTCRDSDMRRDKRQSKFASCMYSRPTRHLAQRIDGRVWLRLLKRPGALVHTYIHTSMYSLRRGGDVSQAATVPGERSNSSLISGIVMLLHASRFSTKELGDEAGVLSGLSSASSHGSCHFASSPDSECSSPRRTASRIDRLAPASPPPPAPAASQQQHQPSAVPLAGLNVICVRPTPPTRSAPPIPPHPPPILPIPVHGDPATAHLRLRARPSVAPPRPSRHECHGDGHGHGQPRRWPRTLELARRTASGR